VRRAGAVGLSAGASFPSANGFDGSYNWNNGVPSHPAPPLLDPTLNAGFVVSCGTGGSVTYGDSEIAGSLARQYSSERLPIDRAAR